MMHWVTAGVSSVEPGTGYEIPGTPGEPRSIPCRFHLGGIKTFKNEDNSVTNQVGSIRCDAGVELPEVGTIITVIGQFKGPVKDVYRGQLSYRIDV